MLINYVCLYKIYIYLQILVSHAVSIVRNAMYASSIVVNIGPPMSDMSLLSVSMHLSFKHQPVINQALYAILPNDPTSHHQTQQFRPNEVVLKYKLGRGTQCFPTLRHELI